MKSRVILIALGISLAFGPSLAAQEKKVVEGQVKIGVHKLDTAPGHIYEVEAKSQEFRPEVQIPDGIFRNTANFNEQNTFRGFHLSSKKETLLLSVAPASFSYAPRPDGVLKYTLTVTEAKLAEKPLFKEADKLTATDPLYANPDAFSKDKHFKAYPLKMKAGQFYVIDMVAAKKDGNKIDPYLFLEGPGKKILVRDDDGGGFPNARIVFRPTADGDHVIIATGLGAASSIGDYTLTVRTTVSAK